MVDSRIIQYGMRDIVAEFYYRFRIADLGDSFGEYDRKKMRFFSSGAEYKYRMENCLVTLFFTLIDRTWLRIQKIDPKFFFILYANFLKKYS